MVLANLLVAIYIFILILPSGFYAVVLANFIESIGFVIKALSESNFLYDCVPHSKNRSKIFNKIESKGSFLFYLLDSISCILTGFFYLINPYMPLCLCFTFCIISAVIAFLFKEVPKTSEEPSDFKNYLKDVRYSFRYILKSNRLKSLILFCGIFYGFSNLLVTLRRSLLQVINLDTKYVGIAFAFWGIFAAISAGKANWFSKKFHNKFLKFSTICLTFSSLISGLIIVLNLSNFTTIVIILIMFSIQHVIKGSYFTLNKKYLNSFSTSNLRTKIYSLNNMFESICATITSLVCSMLLRYTSAAYVTIILSIFFAIVLLIVLSYMKTRIGLNPKQYTKKDIPVEIE